MQNAERGAPWPASGVEADDLLCSASVQRSVGASQTASPKRLVFLRLETATALETKVQASARELLHVIQSAKANIADL